MLISVLFASNRPGNMREFFDNIEETVTDLSCLEVLIKIDAEDPASKEFLDAEIQKRPFDIKYVNSPRLGGYYDLWVGYNDLWRLTSKDSYFVWPITDELRIQTKGWDKIIGRYVGLFPDHAFRLRVSQFKFRNYFRLWECFYAPDNYAIFTRRWVELTNGFGETHGLDAYAQAVVFYLWRIDKWKQASRDVPVLELELEGEAANQGNSDDELEHKRLGVIPSWMELASYRRRIEYLQKAHTVQTYIEAVRMGLTDFKITCDPKKQTVFLINNKDQVVLRQVHFRLSRIATFLKSVFYRMQSTYVYQVAISLVWWMRWAVPFFILLAFITSLLSRFLRALLGRKRTRKITRFVGLAEPAAGDTQNVLARLVGRIKRAIKEPNLNENPRPLSANIIAGHDCCFACTPESAVKKIPQHERAFPIQVEPI